MTKNFNLQTKFTEKIPKVTFVGLPNSGKSSLLNRLLGKRKSLVDKVENTTRDIVEGEEIWDNMLIKFVDTAGIVPDSKEKLISLSQIKSWQAISSCDLILWLIDRKKDPQIIPFKLLSQIRKTGKPFIIVVTKVDDPNLERDFTEFASFGAKGVINISSNTGYGLNDLLDAITLELELIGFKKNNFVQTSNEDLKIKKNKTKKVENINNHQYYIIRNEQGLYESVLENEDINENEKILDLENNISLQKEEKRPIKVLFLGKPNVGKSSLFNVMAGEDFQIVSEIAGTTIGINDLLITRNKKLEKIDEENIDEKEKNQQMATEIQKEYILLDSTGIRKPSQRTTELEKTATFQTINYAHNTDVICLVLDASLPIAKQDQLVAGIAKESGKTLLIIANKSDLLDTEAKNRFIREFEFKLKFLKIKEFIWVSSLYPKGKGFISPLSIIWDKIDQSFAQSTIEISRTNLRKIFNFLIKQKPPKKLRNKRKAIMYDLLYIKTNPPTFELLVKDKDTIHWSYVRFLENLLRKNFIFNNSQVVVKLKNVAQKKVIS